MNMTLRQVHEAPARSVEELQALIDRLTAERQALRDGDADAETLERNRCEIASAQWRLSYALIERHCPQAA